MKIEHVALNVSDPVAFAEWYGKHLGLTVARKMDRAPFAHFLADDGGTVMLEIYNNPPDKVPAYGEMDPLLLHVAFVSEQPEQDRDRLLAAGATLVTELRPDDGSCLIMMRDPWGLAIQLCKRARPMIRTV